MAVNPRDLMYSSLDCSAAKVPPPSSRLQQRYNRNDTGVEMNHNREDVIRQLLLDHYAITQCNTGAWALTPKRRFGFEVYA